MKLTYTTCVKCGSPAEHAPLAANPFTCHCGGKRVEISKGQYDAIVTGYEQKREWKIAHSCHYCGMKATSTGFFGEPVCRECGGH